MICWWFTLRRRRGSSPEVFSCQAVECVRPERGTTPGVGAGVRVFFSHGLLQTPYCLESYFDLVWLVRDGKHILLIGGSAIVRLLWEVLTWPLIGMKTLVCDANSSDLVSSCELLQGVLDGVARLGSLTLIAMLAFERKCETS